MRVVDLDRDMSDVIPTGVTRDSNFLFERMTQRTLHWAYAKPGARVLDVASGMGQDAIALSGRGAWSVGAEPSKRMSDWFRLQESKREKSEIAAVRVPHWVRCWSDCLPFCDDSFDATFCKGAIDHFDAPERAIAEMARVTRPGGRVVLAIANFDSLACRLLRARDVLAKQDRAPGRRHYDVPSDHFTRYELGLMKQQAARWLEIEKVEGISLAWGLPSWARTLERLPAFVANGLLAGANQVGRWLPQLSDVVVLVGQPRSRNMAR